MEPVSSNEKRVASPAGIDLKKKKIAVPSSLAESGGDFSVS